MARRHLVYVLPGFGGSVLERPGPPGGLPQPVWDAAPADPAELLLGHPERLASDEPLRATGAIRSRRLLPGWGVVPGYGPLVRGLRALKDVRLDEGHPDRRDPAADVVVFPYDFRLGVAHAARLLAADVHERLKGYTRADRAGRVIVVAHSSGGLVARYWLGPLQDWPLCRALITLGTPHRGAPKALSLAADGVRLAGVRLDAVSELLRGWPAVADLLPDYPAVWDTAAQTARYPHELPVPGLREAARAGFETHRQIELAWREVPRTAEAPQIRPRLGWSHGTAASATWDGHALEVGGAPPAWLDLAGWRDDQGDGTVPALAAVPAEMSGDDAAGWRVRDRHGPLPAASWLPGLVQAYETGRPLAFARGGGGGRGAALGLDLDDAHVRGAGMPLRVRLRGEAPPPTGAGGSDGAGESDAGAASDSGSGSGSPGGAGSGAGYEGGFGSGAGGEAPATVWARLRAVGGPEPGDQARTMAEVRLDWDPATGAFHTELPGQAPGLYEISVSARSIPGVGDLTSADTVAVVAP